MNYFRHRSKKNNNYDESNSFYEQALTLIPAEVRMISGCHSEQTSADVANASLQNRLPYPTTGRAGGACTSALLEILCSHSNDNNNNSDRRLTFQNLLFELRDSLSNSGYSQIPQLTSSRPLELQQTPFTLTNRGRNRALLVGINYCGQGNGELLGCHNDVYNVKKYLQKYHGYHEHDIQVLVDDAGSYSYTYCPTRQKIIAGLQHLVQTSTAGDSVYFHYSGHGGLLEPNLFRQNNNKQYDETLFPLDYNTAGQIRDYSLYQNFVLPMASGVLVTCVMDCCHSGSVLDLPYSFRPSAGTDRSIISMEQNMMNLSNLTFLYVLMGGTLPDTLFDPIVQILESSLGSEGALLPTYQGRGMENEDILDQAQSHLNEHSNLDDIHHDYFNTSIESQNEGGICGDDIAPPVVLGEVVDDTGVSNEFRPQPVMGRSVNGIDYEGNGYSVNNEMLALPEDSDERRTEMHQSVFPLSDFDQFNMASREAYYEGDDEENPEVPDCGACINDVLGDFFWEENDDF